MLCSALLVVSTFASLPRAETPNPLAAAAVIQVIERPAPPPVRDELLAAEYEWAVDPLVVFEETPIEAASRNILEFLARNRYTPMPTVSTDQATGALLLGVTWYR